MVQALNQAWAARGMWCALRKRGAEASTAKCEVSPAARFEQRMVRVPRPGCSIVWGAYFS